MGSQSLWVQESLFRGSRSLSGVRWLVLEWVTPGNAPFTGKGKWPAAPIFSGPSHLY